MGWFEREKLGGEGTAVSRRKARPQAVAQGALCEADYVRKRGPSGAPTIRVGWGVVGAPRWRAGPAGAASGQLLVDEGRQLRLADCTHLGGGELSVLEQHQRRDAADAGLFRLGWQAARRARELLGRGGCRSVDGWLPKQAAALSAAYSAWA